MEPSHYKIICAVSDNDPYYLRKLLEAGGDLDARHPLDPSMSSPFHYIDSHNVECLDILIEYGGDINRRNLRGFTALHYHLLDCDHHDHVTIFLERGADYTIPFPDGRPLESTSGWKFVVKYLESNVSLDVKGVVDDFADC
jgi:hypothetical protein